MRLFDDEDNYLFEDDLSDIFDKFAYYHILGEKLSFEIYIDDEKLFDVLRRELSEWLVRGVSAELRIAQEENIPYFLLQGRSDGGTKPTAAKDSDKIYKWTWDNLKLLIGGSR